MADNVLMNVKYNFLTLLLAANLSHFAQAAETQDLKPLLLKAKAMTFSMHPKEALSTYKLVLSKDPSNAEAFAGLGWVYYQLGRPKDAIAYEKKAIALDPQSAEPHYYLAAIYMSQKQYQSSDNERILATKLAKMRPCNCGHLSELSKPQSSGQ